jgi:ribosome biogenesis GTPase
MNPAGTARLLSHHGRQAWVLCDSGERRLCVYRGRGLQPVANDQVSVDLSGHPGVVNSILPRRNQITRSESHRSKTLAANIDQVLIVISGSPLFSDELLCRMICACAAESIPGVVVLNKTDLLADTDRARHLLDAFRDCLSLLGWTIIETSARSGNASAQSRITTGIETLCSVIDSKASLVMGASGMGKSSLMNVLVPGLNAQTREISEALQTGKHTTTAAYVACVDDDTWLIDTPGFQLFGLHHLSITQRALGFPEFQRIRALSGACRYANCRHDAEPSCKIKESLENGLIAPRRLELWRSLIAD